jgi:hypothetical protein
MLDFESLANECSRDQFLLRQSVGGVAGPQGCAKHRESFLARKLVIAASLADKSFGLIRRHF